MEGYKNENDLKRCRQLRELFGKVIENQKEEQKKQEESYVIHTPEGESLSPVVRQLLKENPLICTWR